jgi:hypothetical protein
MGLFYKKRKIIPGICRMWVEQIITDAAAWGQAALPIQTLQLHPHDFPFRHRPPVGYFFSQPLNALRIRFCQIVFLIRISLHIIQTWTCLIRRILHFPLTSIIGKQELPIAIDNPAIKQGILRFMNIGNIMGESFSKDRVTTDLLSAFQRWQQVHPGQVLRHLDSRSS